MISRRALGLMWIGGLTVGVLGACGATDDGASDLTEGDGGIDGSGDGSVAPVRAEFGLDSRPANATCKAVPRPPTTDPAKWERVFATATLNGPMMIAQIPGDSSRWFVAERDGAIRSFSVADPANIRDVVQNIGALPGVPGGVRAEGEGGLLGIAFHPKFAQNHRLYVTWTTFGGSTNFRSAVGYLTTTDNGATFGDYKQVLLFEQPPGNQNYSHKGGGIAFGKEGLLYLSFGDGGGVGDPNGNGQTKTGFFSKVLRIDVDNVPGGQTYGIPDTNPFKNGGGEPAVLAYGFRNPFRLSIDRETNDLWVGDVGQETYEEIDAKVKPGDNYGWPCREGLHAFTDLSRCPPGTVGTVDPILELSHEDVKAVIGGVVYRGKAIPQLFGRYIFGDYVNHRTYAFSADAAPGPAKMIPIEAPAVRWVNFAEDNDGEVYGVALEQGQIFRLVEAEPAGQSTVPDRLSKTGCVDATDPTKPAAGLIPYGVQSPLWSDGAKKERWLAVPDGQKITVSEHDGDFDFPIGTVLVKTFSLGDKRIETRLFMRHEDGGWAGYTYEWLDDQSDATLLGLRKTKTFGTQTWAFPGRSDCLSCHTEAAGGTLGLEIGQINGEFVYTATNRISNQLKTLEHIGMFDRPLGQLLVYPNPLETAGTLEARARAYLHSNCSNCHRPKGGGRGKMDLRFGTSLADTNTCNAMNEAGDLGIAGGKLLVPGSPETSILSVRPHSPRTNRMPPLASSVVDDPGLKVLDDWIRSLTDCL